MLYVVILRYPKRYQLRLWWPKNLIDTPRDNRYQIPDFDPLKDTTIISALRQLESLPPGVAKEASLHLSQVQF